jgi:hypothetical protein
MFFSFNSRIISEKKESLAHPHQTIRGDSVLLLTSTSNSTKASTVVFV